MRLTFVRNPLPTFHDETDPHPAACGPCRRSGIRQFVADGYPCRYCLRETRAGQEVRRVHWPAELPQSGCASSCARIGVAPGRPWAWSAAHWLTSRPKRSDHARIAQPEPPASALPKAQLPLRNVTMLTKQLSGRPKGHISNRVRRNALILLSLTPRLAWSRSTVRY
jgi:hypothetical protein